MPELDGIRGVAIIMVLLFHGFALSMQNDKWAGIPRWVELGTRFGWAGVELFFVLSGFLITGILLDSAGKPNYFRNFYARRALRILPLYYITLILVAVLYKGSLSFVGVSAVYLSNVAPIFGIAVSYPTLWSLSVEEHFYLLWPWFVARLRPSRLSLLAAGILVAEPILRGTALSHTGNIHRLIGQVYSYSWFRFDGLAAGALLACFVRSGWFSRERLYQIGLFALVAAAVMSAAVLPSSGLLGDALLFSYIAVLFTGLVSTVLSGAVSPLCTLMRSRWLRKCGVWSHCLYPIHPLIFDEWGRAFGMFPAPVVGDLGRFGAIRIRALVVFAVCLALAELSRGYFEGPLLPLKRYFEYPSLNAASEAQAPERLPSTQVPADVA